MFDNRQIATLLWVGILTIAALLNTTARRSLREILSLLIRPAILTLIAVLAGWSVLLVRIGDRVGLWTPALAGDTWFWFFTTALVLLFNLRKVSEEQDFFTKASREVLGVTLVLSFLSDLAVFSLPVEFLGQTVLFLAAALAVYTVGGGQDAATNRAARGCLSGAGLLVLVLAVRNLVVEWPDSDKADLARQLALPVWMTLGVLPVIYLTGLYAAYQMAFMKIGFVSGTSRRARVRAKAALVLGLHGHATDVGRFVAPWTYRIAHSSTLREAVGVTRDFEADLEQTEIDRREEAARVIRDTGSDGVDEDGRRLDRREFEETKAALRWVASCQFGRYRPRQSYERDLETMLYDLSDLGLPSEPAMVLEVSDDGQAWFAWRRTVSGWVFAIGANAPPTDQWKYDGPAPPAGFPGSDPVWGPQAFGYKHSPNW